MARMSQGLPLPSGNRGLLIIAALAGLAAAVLFVVAVRNDNGNTTTSIGAGTGGNTVVALKNIPAASKIEADMVATKKVPDDLLVAGAFPDTAKVVGQYAAYDITVGDQITPGRIGAGNPAVCGMACVVEPGTVGVGMEVKEVTAVGGLLYPGNRVNVTAVFKIKNDGSVEGCPQQFFILRTETILQNVQVLSVAQQQVKPAGANNTGSRDPNSGVSGVVPPDTKQQPGAATLTVALNPVDTQVLISAQERARSVWASVRPVGDTEVKNIPPSNECLYE